MGSVGGAAALALAAVLAFAAVVAALATTLSLTVVLALAGVFGHMGSHAVCQHRDAGIECSTVVLSRLCVEASRCTAEETGNGGSESEIVYGACLHEEYLSSVRPHPLVGRALLTRNSANGHAAIPAKAAPSHAARPAGGIGVATGSEVTKRAKKIKRNPGDTGAAAHGQRNEEGYLFSS